MIKKLVNKTCRVHSYLFLLGSKGQYTPNNSLVPAETFGFGGYDYGMGYAYNMIYGDSGVAGKFELQVNKAIAKNRFLIKNVQFYLFSDYGIAWSNIPNNPLQNATQGLSGGAGSRLFLAKGVKADFFLAKPFLSALPNGQADMNVYPFFYINADFQ